MFVHTIDPAFLHLGPVTIRYYGLIYALGFAVAYVALRRAIEKKELPLRKEDADTLLLCLIIGVVVGARVFEVIFYSPSYYLASPLKILALWEGGLSFHGGLVGAAAAATLFCRKKKTKFLQLADALTIPAAFALAMGRFANFINGELYGVPTSLPWGVLFPGAQEYRHPTQIYEALKNLVIAGILLQVKKRPRHQGHLFGVFLLLYATFRFVIEFWKEPEVAVGFLTMGQILSLAMLPIAIRLLKKSGK